MPISILLPTYRRPHQLREALASLVSQNRALIGEILIGDDSPAHERRDNEAVIAQSGLAELVRYIPNDPPKGNYPNQWALGDQASGDHVLILHDDDHLCPGALATLAHACATETDPAVEVWFGRVLMMNEEGIVDDADSSYKGALYGKGGAGAVKPVWEWCLTQALPPDCALFPRTTYQKLMRGPRDGNVGDWGLAVRLANSGARGRFIAVDISRYRAQTRSMTNAGRGIDVHYMYEIASQLQVPPHRMADKEQLMQGFVQVATTRYLRDGERLLAWKCLLSSHWRWTQRLSARGIATLLMLMTPAPCWRWTLRHRT